ncbi:MAG: biopolymer transporter ExbD [Myxococcales bacterium]|nr:biopolymer transporter ExbD [Myxococcales bacterium]MCB9704009.1 biopolymer transporter ExbD [Myxococcales bacterium]
MKFRSDARGLRVRRGGAGGAVVDLTPLIDVTFQLLIFFLLTASFRNESAFKVQLPKAKTQEPATEQNAVVVKISEDGQIEIDRVVVDDRELELRLCRSQEGSEEGVTINIKADKNTRHERLVQVMDLARTCGIKKMGILSKS